MNFSEIQTRLEGPVFSVVLPFKETGEEIDFKALERYLDYAYASGARKFYVMAYNSRFSELSWDEIKRVNEHVVKFLKNIDQNNIVIVADPLHCSTATSIDFCKHAEEIGADIISLIFREKFYTNEQIYKHYSMCAESAASIGILIHEMPLISGLGGHTINWPLDLLDQLADIPNIIAIKEDAKDDNYTKSLVSLLENRMSIIISGGGKRQWLRFADIGCRSWLNGVGVFEPKLAIAFWNHYKSNNLSKCMQIINEIEVPFFEKAVSQYGWHLAIKAALEARGHFSRIERMPMLAINEKQYKDFMTWFPKLPVDELCN